jgi:hypothetical protein
MIETKVETQDLISQLGREIVVSYETDAAFVVQIVTALLAFQVQTPAITLGTIDPSYYWLIRAIKVDGDTILRALYRLRDTVGGYIYVDNNRALQWVTSLGEDKGQQIRYRKNLKGIEREIDYTQLFNRIYAYGAGEGDARIVLTAPGYVEDVPSQTEWGGIYRGVFIDRSITHPDTLLAWANLLLTDHADPVISYRIDTVDLSQSTELDFSFDALQLGSKVTVIDEDLGINVSVNVVKITHPNLLHPEQMTVDLANSMKDITDTLSEVYDIQQFNNHIATEIGAGQVIVKGTFTVLDWASAGVTTINGANITTGTISVDTLTGGTLGSIYITLGAGTVFRTAASPAPRIELSQTLLAGYSDATTKQFYLQASDGKAYAAGGDIILDSTGITVKDRKAYFYYGSTLVGRLGATSASNMSLYCDNGTLRLDGDTYLNLYCDAGDVNIVAYGTINTTGTLRPSSDNANNLGGSSYRWKDFYAVTVHEGDTVFANDWRLTESADGNGIRLLRPDGSLAQEWR